MKNRYEGFVPGLVLVVDDVEDNRILARAYLERIGWEVDECASGAAAIEYLERKVPRAMLIDIDMPDITGDQLASHVRSELCLRRVRLVGYTAHCFPEELARFKSAGFDEMLVKPAPMEAMAQALPDPRTATPSAARS